MCYFSFFDEENADHTLGLTTVKTKEMFRLLHKKENNNTNNYLINYYLTNNNN